MERVLAAAPMARPGRRATGGRDAGWPGRLTEEADDVARGGAAGDDGSD
jgi:hypothetical protein